MSIIVNYMSTISLSGLIDNLASAYRSLARRVFPDDDGVLAQRFAPASIESKIEFKMNQIISNRTRIDVLVALHQDGDRKVMARLRMTIFIGP
jgi:hypothetical protein